MRLGPGETLRADALRRWVRVLDLRTLLLGLCALEVIFFPTVPEHRARTIVLELAFVAYSAALAWRLRLVRRLEPWFPVTDALMVAVFAAALPDAWPAFVASEVVVVAFAVIMHGRVIGWLTTAVGAVSLALAATQVHTDGAVGVSSFILLSAIVTVGVGFARADEADVAERYTSLVNGIHGIVWEFDLQSQQMTVMSEQVEDILGWTVEEAKRRETWTERGADTDPRELVRAALIDGDADTELRVRHADGHVVWLRARTVADGHVVRGTLTDTTAEHEAALALQQYADMIAGMPIGAAVWHLADDDPASLRLVSMNAAMARLTKLSMDSVGRRLPELYPDGRAVPIGQVMAAVVRSNTAQFVPESPYEHPDGRAGYFSSVFIPLPGNCVAALNEDITERHEAEEALRHQALHDSLTGLPNRALLHDRLDAAVAISRRTGSPVALLVMDLDQFKEVNDTLGHPMGDRLLKRVAGRLASVLRDCDTVSRLGGDEFAVLLTTDATPSGVRRVAERVGIALSAPFDLDGISVRTAASIGIVVCPEHGDDAGTLIQRADVAMYTAKRSGQGHCFYASEDDHSSVRRLSLAADLHTAVSAQQLVLYYQPQEDLATGEVIGVEALVRWNHPELGLVPPVEFIPLAEVSGAIVPLTRWVIRSAIEQAAAFRDAGFPIVVSANVSGRNLYDPELPSSIERALREFELPPELLLERDPESELVDDPSQVMMVLTIVAEMGVRVAVDDFGTGWSSLSNLIRLPVEQIKIDRSFVAGMTDHGDAGVIVRSIIDLGHNLGLDVVAEGVETDAIRDALRALGCDQGQGYLLAKPMPEHELLAWLAARRELVTSA